MSKLIALAALCAATPFANAALLNGSFEAGLAGWHSAGDAAAVAGDAPDGSMQLVLTTAAASFDDDAPAPAGSFNVSGLDPLAAGAALESFIGLAPGALDPDPSLQAFEGSAASQSFVAAAGTVLSFRWRFASNDTLTGDYAFVVLDGVLMKLADLAQLSGPGATWALQSGEASFTHAFTSSGSHSVAFGVVDIHDFSASSALFVDAVRVSAVPEPSSTALLALGLGLGAFAVARRRAGKP